MPTKEELWNSFDQHFKTIVEDLSSVKGVNSGIAWSIKRIKEILEYNVPFGKRTRGITVVSSFYSIKSEKVSPEEQTLALTLGWAVEILQAAFLVADDLMDQSKTRRGQLCWYRKSEVGLQAVNDCLILETCVFTLLKGKFRHLDCYADLVDLFHEILFHTEMGQSLDMATSEKPEVDFSLFSEERYTSIIKHKTAFYSFYLPIGLALYLAGISCEKCHDEARGILTQMGCLFQIQDDYLDCFGDPDVTGKIGTDIEDNKCTWLIVKAIKIASPDQLKQLEMNYGKKKPDQVQNVKKIYLDLDMQSHFFKYETEAYESLINAIDNFNDPRVPKSVFFNFLNKIYKRNK